MPEQSNLQIPALLPADRRDAANWMWVPACFLLALVQVGWAGYQLGVGNQSIQMAFLKAMADPNLFLGDSTITRTLGDYPSLFFASLISLLKWMDVPGLYLVLHLLVAGLTMLAAAMLARTLFHNHWAAGLLLLMLLPGHQQALAGEVLYSNGFTHTWVVFPLSLLTLVLFHRGMYWGAAALVGFIFNFHALEAGYLLVLIGLWVLFSLREIGIRRLLGCSALMLLIAGPTLYLMTCHSSGSYDQAWLGLMHIRSGDRSFPSSWWQTGSIAVPRFAVLIGLAALASSFSAEKSIRQKMQLASVAIGLLFMVGYVLTELYPVPVVIRAQLFRSSRLLVILSLAQIAYGCVQGWRLAWQQPSGLQWWRKGLELLLATLVACGLVVPSLTSLLPAVLVLGILVALINGRLHGYQALIAGGAVLICLGAWRNIHFVLPGLSPELGWQGLVQKTWPSLSGWMMLAMAAGLWVLAVRSLARWQRWTLGGVGLGVALGMAVWWYPTWLSGDAGDPYWTQVQQWAKVNTPRHALFLTPSQMTGFRIGSDRAIVGEWRDGTQLYFSPSFATPWRISMEALQPGMVYSPDQQQLLTPGRSIVSLGDEELIALAQRFGADYLVLTPSDKRQLRCLYSNARWAVYEPVIPPPPPQAQEDPVEAQERFMQQVVLPNIEKHRKNEVALRLLDAQGRPLLDAGYTITQTSSPLEIGCSLGVFVPRSNLSPREYVPPPVHPKELELFLPMFNYSVIRYSGQWRYLEPQVGKRDYADLDAYVDWCHKHGVKTELHFVAGYPPDWTSGMSQDQLDALLVQHAEELAQRYGDKIDAWQITHDQIGMEVAPALFEAVRRLAPKAKLGVSTEARFFSYRSGVERDRDMHRGLTELYQLTTEKKIKVDYMAIQGHRPLGLWADARDMYEVFDALAQANVRLRISELGLPLDPRWPNMVGKVQQEPWTAATQAEYYERFLTVCFSHPAVEAVNLAAIGPDSWIPGAGLLDENYQPKPAYRTLEALINQRLRTNLQGSVGLDGAINFRAFHGEYQLTLTTTDGKTVQTRFAVRPGQDVNLRYQLDTNHSTLTVQP